MNKPINVLLINANDYTNLSGADIYSHRLIELINRHYDAKITEYSYDMCVYSRMSGSSIIKNVNVLYPSAKRNYRDAHWWLKWAATNFWNAVYRCNRQIREIAPKFDLIICGAMILYTDKKIMSQPNFLLIQHQSYDFIKLKRYKFWTWLAIILTYLYGTRDCFKRAKNQMLFTEFDKQRILADAKTKLDRNIFLVGNSKFSQDEINNHWIKKQNAINKWNFTHDCLYVGRICKQQKRVHLYNTVAKILKLDFACVGDGSYFKKMKKDNIVKCYGAMKSDKIGDLYINSKCSVLLSDYEGMPGSATEAIASGTPVITTADCESNKYMQSKLGDAVQIISSRLKGKKLANEVRKRFEIITHDKNKYKKMCAECIDFAKEELSLETFEKSWTSAINQLIKK